MGEVRHGVDGWQLSTYAWNPATGEGVFRYRRVGDERREVIRAQPAGPQHRGWVAGRY